MPNVFSQNQKTKIGSNTFDLSHDRKMSGKIGKLMPFLAMDCIPGDSIDLNSSVMCRMAPMVAPVMHNVRISMHYFFVPNRLVWDEWEDYITGGEQSNSPQPVWPHLEIDYSEEDHMPVGSLGDYLGIPPTPQTLGTTERNVSAIPFAAYNMIYNEYYRDQQLITPLQDTLGEGVNNRSLFNTVQNRAWQHDYFTSALPNTQKGPDAMIPLGTEAQIKARPAPIAKEQIFREVSGVSENDPIPNENIQSGTVGDVRGDTQGGWIDLNDSHYTDLSTATAASIIDLRNAFKLQEWLEKNARGGSRYIESIAVHFGVTSKDQRLQRPEFLGGFNTPLKIAEVLQTGQPVQSPGQDATPTGTMTGHGLGVGGGKPRRYYCEEHGYIIGIMSVTPKTAYSQGIPKHFLRRDKFDYFWPEFAHIGDEPIEEMEIYQTDLEDGLDTFGYKPRYADYKFITSSVHGDFRGSLDRWHMARKFASQPALNQDFIECDYEEIERIFAVEDGTDHLWIHCLNDIKAKRKMPYFSNPKF